MTTETTPAALRLDAGLGAWLPIDEARRPCSAAPSALATHARSSYRRLAAGTSWRKVPSTARRCSSWWTQAPPWWRWASPTRPVWAGVVLVLGRPEVPTPLQVAWCMCLLAALVLRAVVWRAHVAAFNPGSGLAAAQPCAATVALWLRRYRLAYFGHGMAWGLAAALMPPLMNADGQTQLIFAFAALVAGGVAQCAQQLARHRRREHAVRIDYSGWVLAAGLLTFWVNA